MAFLDDDEIALAPIFQPTVERVPLGPDPLFSPGQGGFNEARPFTNEQFEALPTQATPDTPSRSINERMLTLDEKMAKVARSPLGWLFAAMEGAGAGLQGRKPDVFAGLRAGHESALQQRAQGLQEQEFGLRVKEGERREAAEKRKQAGIERFKARDWSKIIEGPTSGIVDAAKDIIDFDADAGIGLIKLGMAAKKDERVKAQLVDAQRQLGQATSREEAARVLQGLDPDLSSKLESLVKLSFPETKEVAVGTDRNALAIAGGFKNFQEAPREVQKSINLQVTRDEQARLKLAQAQIVIQQQGATTRTAGQLRDDFRQDSKSFFKTSDAFGQLEALAKNPNPAGDISFIFAYSKLLDPESTVREGEVATIKNSVGLDDKIRNLYNRVIKGEHLTAKQREEFLDRAKGMFRVSQESHNNRKGFYSRLARESGVDPQSVVMEEVKRGEGIPASTKQATHRFNPATGKIEPAK